jgi:adenine-specific DNA-methyltransferase
LFSYPKAVDYVKKIVMMATDKKDAIILDFFAGSGTTGHAVLELNEQDSGTRQFILCQLNEKTDSTPQGIAYDVTTKRLKRIMTGECYDGSRNFKWAQDNLPYGGNLDVYEIEGVTNDNATENHTPFDVIDETLYGQDRFSTFREKVKWVCANFSHTQKYIENDEEWEQRQKEVDNATGE